jgi:hypothetical protein
MRPWVALPLLMSIALVSVVWLRYDNPWAEGDTVTLARAARGVLDEGTIAPSQGAYDHGFAFPTLLATLSLITGISVYDIQAVVLPWLTVATSLVAFVAFRGAIGSSRAGAIAASLLLVQPDFLFVSQRGSHEKMTWTLVLTLIYLLVVSLEGRSLRHIVPYVIAFYLSGFALLTTNAFFGSSFTTMILLSLLVSVFVTRRFFAVPGSRSVLPRVTYVFLILSVLIYLVMFYIYGPAGRNLANLGRIVDRLAVLYLNVDPRVESHINVASNAPVSQSSTIASPYSAISLSWTSLDVYFMLTLFTWVMLVVALFSWLILGVTFFRRGVTRHEVPLYLLWTFSAASGVQIALSIAADYAGTLGSNLQLRLFPAFSIFVIPMIIATITRFRVPQRSPALRYTALMVGIVGLIAAPVVLPGLTIIAGAGFILTLYLLWNWHRSPRARRVATVVGIGAYTYFASATVLKATNDPLVSNKWTFFTDAEARGIRWADQEVDRMPIWADFDERIGSASQLLQPDGDAFRETAYWTRNRDLVVRYVFMSGVIEERAARTSAILPDVRDDDLIYDNGQVKIAHRVPATPYQP